MNESEFKKSIKKLLKQEKALLNIVKNVSKNDAQKAIIVEGLCQLKKVSELLDILALKRKEHGN